VTADSPANSGRVGVDTGGTFTDVVSDTGQVVKLDSRPDEPAAPVAAGVARVGGARVLAHGTTVATNALLERGGGRVALITTAGQRDVIEIARQARPSLYDPWADRPLPLVPRHLRFEVAGRLDAAGCELAPPGAPPAVPAGVDVVAVCLLHADRNPAHERAIAGLLAGAGLGGAAVVCSSDVSPEYREYERTVTTVADAYLRRPCQAYLRDLQRLGDEVLVMTSAGGLIPLADAVARPVRLLLSGPAGGVLAAASAAVAAGYGDCVSFDMGGTSTDVCLIRAGRPEPAAERRVAGLPIRMPALDVHTIGAGGGSIAAIDAGGALVVGPQSAGADPGPACYGRGGHRPTVTDADLVAGRIPLEGLAGLGRLDLAGARRALDAARLTAGGVIAVVDHAMVQAVRVVSVQRGVDPAGLALVAFGGAGPLHACALAEALGMPAVVVPPRAGVLSAVGMLAAPRQLDRVRSWPDPADHAGAEAAARALGAEAAAASAQAEAAGADIEIGLDCRYAGQSHELTVAGVAGFEAEHARRNGFLLTGAPVEVVAIRASARWPSPVDLAALASAAAFRPDRTGSIAGPAVVAEPDCTVWVASGWRADAHPSGSWLLTRAG
jgi:N-methylhydantoinase A/oxoprolinase/acetone carboxylase beta subunit